MDDEHREQRELEEHMLGLARATVEVRRQLRSAHRFWVYVIELNNGFFYVGETDNIWLRLVHHISASPSSAKWVRRHGFRRVIEVVRNAGPEAETTKTLQWMSMFGWERVRGASFCALDLPGPPTALASFDRFAHAYDHLTAQEVAQVEATARELAQLLSPTDPEYGRMAVDAA